MGSMASRIENLERHTGGGEWRVYCVAGSRDEDEAVAYVRSQGYEPDDTEHVILILLVGLNGAVPENMPLGWVGSPPPDAWRRKA